MVPWPSGQAKVCNTLYSSSNLLGTSEKKGSLNRGPFLVYMPVVPLFGSTMMPLLVSLLLRFLSALPDDSLCHFNDSFHLCKPPGMILQHKHKTNDYGAKSSRLSDR